MACAGAGAERRTAQVGVDDDAGGVDDREERAAPGCLPAGAGRLRQRGCGSGGWPLHGSLRASARGAAGHLNGQGMAVGSGRRAPEARFQQPIDAGQSSPPICVRLRNLASRSLCKEKTRLS